MTPFEESLRRAEAMLRRELFIGRGAHSGRLYFAKPEDYLSTHTHLIGASNFGKSFYLEHLLQSYTALRIPAGLIDPHGDHARHYDEHLARIPQLRREGRVVRFAPGSGSPGPGFNPFACGLSNPAEVASLVLEAFMKVWGEHSFNETPRLERILRILFHVLAANSLPLTEAHQFLIAANRPFRQNLLARVEDPRVRASWQEIEELPKLDKLERFESSWNRLQRFLATPAVANLFAPQPRTLNFAEMFNRGQILVADLSRLHSTDAQSLVGTMIVNALYNAAKRRPEGKRRHWVLAIDEFPQFVTADIARNLDQIRKFGVRLILAHQHLAQIPEDLRASLLTNARIEMVFGGLSRADAEILARELFTGSVRGDRVKHVTRQTKFRPHLVPVEVEARSYAETEGSSESDSWSEGFSRGAGTTESDSLSERLLEDQTDETVTHALARSSSSSESNGRSWGTSSSRAKTEGRTLTNTFVTDHEEFAEETGRQFWSLDEEWERLVTRVMRLEPREALLKVGNRQVIDILTPEIRRLPPRRSRCRGPKPKPSGNGGMHPASAPPASASAKEDLPEDFRE